MTRRLKLLSLAMAGLAAGCATVKNEVRFEDNMGPLPEFNEIVLRTAARYPTDGTHDYWWPKKNEPQYDGASENITFGGKQLMRGEEEGRTYCCGLTLEVFVRAYEEWSRLHNVTPSPALADGWGDFKRHWFVLAVNGPGPSAALEKYDLGRTIPPHEALPGDFVQLWRRDGSGHSVIFLEWVRDKKDRIVGLKYWSTQPATNGIGERIEYFGENAKKKHVAWEHSHWGRVELE